MIGMKRVDSVETILFFIGCLLRFRELVMGLLDRFLETGVFAV